MEYDELSFHFLHVSSWKAHVLIVRACVLRVSIANEAIQRGRKEVGPFVRLTTHIEFLGYTHLEN